MLPGKLRDPVALGYLLARATDTVADTSSISPALREEALTVLAFAIEGTGSREQIVRLINAFTPQQRHEPERRLIAALPQCLHWFGLLNAADRKDLRAALAKITKGQML